MRAPSVSIGLEGVVAVAAVLGVGVLALWLVKNRQLFNPADERNLANQAASSVVKAVTGGAAEGGEDSVGGVFARFREWASGDDARIRDMLKGSPALDRNVVTPDDPGVYYGTPGS